MSENKYWKLVVIGPDELVTNPIMTLYERAKVLSTAAEYVYTTYETHLDTKDMYVSTEDISQDIKDKIVNEDMYELDGKPCVRLSNTLDIAKVMLNKKVAPFKIIREIGRDPGQMKIWVEVWDVNNLQTETFIPFT